MNISIVSKRVDITGTMRNKIEDTLSKIGKYIKEDVDVNVKLDVKKNNQKVEVTMYLNDGKILRAEEVQPDLYSAIDLVYDKIYKQLRKYKTQTLRKQQKNESIKFENIEAYAALDLDNDNSIKKRKKVNIDKPMTEEEAVIQMDLLGHDFFIYKDSTTVRTCILYKRHDGYGLIEQV